MFGLTQYIDYICESTAEETIRAAYQSSAKGVNKWEAFSVTFNGRKQDFMGMTAKVNSTGKAHSVIHMIQIRPGRLMTGDEVSYLSVPYQLDGKNKMNTRGVPRHATPEEIKMWKDSGLDLKGL